MMDEKRRIRLINSGLWFADRLRDDGEVALRNYLLEEYADPPTLRNNPNATMEERRQSLLRCFGHDAAEIAGLLPEYKKLIGVRESA